MAPTGHVELAPASEVLNQLRPDDRETLITKLAEILVLDYQQNQGVSGHTVEKPALFNRRKGQGKPG
jgi:hypothetical protein